MTKYTHNNMIKKYKLFESPDKVFKKDGKIILWTQEDGITFGYSDYDPEFGFGDERKLYIGKTKYKFTHSDIDPSGNGREEMEYAGRLWYKEKYVSFWDYPQNKRTLISIMKELSKKIKKEYGIDINFDPKTWWIEIVVDEDGGRIEPDDKSWNNVFKTTMRYDADEHTDVETRRTNSESMPTDIILIKDYDGSGKRSSTELAALHFDPKAREMEKQRKLDAGEDIVPKGWGGRFYDDKLPKGMPEAQYRAKKTKYKYTESMIETTLTGFLNENVFDKAKKKEKEPHYQIMCDMDGVICDWDRQFNEMFLDKFNKENHTKIKNGWEFEEKYGKNIFWKGVDDLGIKFWSEMPWTKDGRKLWNFIKQFDNTEILTKPSLDIASKKGKKIWCEEEIGDIKVNFSYNKEQMAKPNRILIDDLEKNIIPWVKAGGIGILHKNTEDTIKKLKKYI